MLVVETIRKIRLSVKRDGKSIRQTARELNLSRNTVRKVLRGDLTMFEYKRQVQHRPKLGSFVEALNMRLKEDDKLPSRRRRTARKLHEELQQEGYEGGYDSVRRYLKHWRKEHSEATGQVFIPLWFDPGEAFQFDWSHEWVLMAGMPVKAKVAHLRLCHSRMFLSVAYPRETQEMVFDAHLRAFGFFGGVCRRGIYDNLRAVVNKILLGKQRSFNNRFGQLSSHYLFEPLACTPGAGWEKGQVESQVKTVRRNFFTPQVRVTDFAELNARLKSFCIGWAKTHRHPEIAGQMVFEAFEAEKPYLLSLPPPFDGYAERPSRVSPSALISFDRNRYSVDCRYVGQAVQLRIYADRVVIVKDSRIIGEHAREFGRDKTVFNPWHYLAAIEVKPGCLRNGAPFKGWDLPQSLQQVHGRLKQRYTDWDRQFAGILAAVPLYGLEAVEAACRQALTESLISKEAVLNLLHRGRDHGADVLLYTDTRLILQNEPIADCQRYDRLLREVHHAAQ